MYLAELAATIRSYVPNEKVPDGDAEALFLHYAALLRAKGAEVTASDVHDAWAAWMAPQEVGHEALVPYGDLEPAVAAEDQVFVDAIRRASLHTGHVPGNRDFLEILFPDGAPSSPESRTQALDLYKMMVDSSEALVSRRQAVNTFFLTINGALLTAAGLLVQNANDLRLGALGVMILAMAGALLSRAWRSLLVSFGQLNSGKFKVINTIERYLSVSIYAAEWEALGRGEDPKVYQSFTSREVWVPNALTALYVISVLVAFSFAVGWLSVGSSS